MALMAVLPKEAVQQLFSHVLWMPPTLTWCCFDSLVLFLGSAAGAQPLLFLPLQHFAACKTPGGTTDEVAEMSSWLSPPLIGAGDTLWGSTGPCFFSPLLQFCVKNYGFICLGCLALCQPLTGGGGLPAREPHTDTPSRMLVERALCLWQPLPPTLDTASGLGAAVSGLLLALQTSLDPGSDRPGLWGEGEPRCCFDPCALLHVVYLQVLAPAQRKRRGKNTAGVSDSSTPRRCQRQCWRPQTDLGALGAAKNWLELDHSWGRFSEVNTRWVPFFFFFMSKRDRFDTSSSLSSPLSFPLIFLLKVRPNKSELHKLKAEIRVPGQMLICEDLRKIGTNKSTHWSSRLSLLFLPL